MSRRESWDVIVVGAGPAGAASAARLARYGHRVLLLDRAEFPRSKPCGECLNPAALEELRRLGVLDRVAAAGGARLEGWHIQPAGVPAFAGHFPAGACGLALSRAVLDAELLAHARACGAEFATARVVDLIVEHGRVVGVRTNARGELRARLAIGADGLRSVVVRRLGLVRHPPRLRKVALAAHVHGAASLGGRGLMYVDGRGCVGVAEVGEGAANVVVVANDAERGRVAGDPERYFDEAVQRVPALAAATRVEDVLATGPFDLPVRRAIADGALLVGDAAGYYDPFTGQGVYRALHGAALAAAVADRALRRGDLSAAALHPYERARRRAFRAGERVQRIIEQFVARPWLLGAAARVLARHQPLANTLFAVTADLEPVRSLFSPRVLFASTPETAS